MFLPFVIGAKETYFHNPLIMVTIFFFLFSRHSPLHHPLLPGIPATLASLSLASPLTLPLLGITRHLVTNHQALFPRLHLVPKSPPSLLARFSYYPFLTSKCYCTSCSPNPLMPHSSTSSQILVEYAKSGRSSCKKCSETIASNALRLGLVTRDNRGFDVTKWHHFDCFPYGFESVASAEGIKGFSSLKSSDQEALKKLLAGHDKSRERDDDATEDIQNEPKKPNTKKRKGDEATEETQNEQEVTNLKKRKVHEATKDINIELKETNPKERNPYSSDVEAGVNFIFSVSDIKSKYKEATLLPKWKAFQTVIFLEQDDGLHNSSKIAAFDFDGCLAKTYVKRVGADAWSLMYPSIPVKLQSLYNDGYKLVIFTNESNIERWKNKRQVAVDSKIGRLNNFIKKVKVPIQVFIACGLGKSLKQNKEAEDPFRKPRPGMWQLMEKHFNSDIAIDMDQSFYVGDAAGRVKDHSDADVKFAEAIGLKFYVPEEFFDSQGK